MRSDKIHLRGKAILQGPVSHKRPPSNTKHDMKSFLHFYIGASLTVLITAATDCNASDASTATPEPTSALTAQQLPNPEDGAHPTLARLKDLHGYRYMEFFLVGSEPVDGQIKGVCYNRASLG